MPISKLSAPTGRTSPNLTNQKTPFRYRWGLLLFLLITSGLVWGGSYLTALGITVTHGGVRTTVLQQISRLLAARDQQVSGESRDRINVLLMGIGGAGHDGPLLADTLILASIKPSTQEISLLSIPRDLAVDIPRYGIRKINNANAFGRDMNYPGGGEQLTADLVAEVTGVPVDYYARVDFEAFREIIDRVNGINVTVDTAFSDNEYPDYRHGYMPIRFAAGEQKMDGERALEFVRSRHGTNGEGSDFARAARQQKVLLALRSKALSLGTILNPKRVTDIVSALADHTQTNMELWEMVRLATLVDDIPAQNIANRVLDASSTGPLKVATGTDGAYLLVPRAGLQNWTDVQTIAQNIFSLGKIQNEKASIVVVNSSTIRGLAEREGQSLSILNYNVVATANAKTPGSTQNVIVDFSGGAKPNTVSALAERYNASVSTAIPASVDPKSREYPMPTVAGGTGRADLLLIVGRDPSATTKPVQEL